MGFLEWAGVALVVAMAPLWTLLGFVLLAALIFGVAYGCAHLLDMRDKFLRKRKAK